MVIYFSKCSRISCLIEKTEANNVMREDYIEKPIPKLVGNYYYYYYFIYYFFWGGGVLGKD